MIDRLITDLCPALQAIYPQWKAQCNAAGLAVSVIVTYRSPIDQENVKALGLSNAGAGQSPHGCVDANGHPASMAWDWACFDENAKYITDGSDPRYRQAGEIGKSLGLSWGGDWVKWKDWDHLELAGWKDIVAAQTKQS